ncbi:hypothetical protein BGZ74_008259 [Mortierella antarctica]|nr:hypothetical protein BGZ74_008259 [Mortierella antarctica]
MVFVNGQKFACERPLHEIKKKGRPSIQCAHCKELRKAKHVTARCICGKDEGAAAVANGLKRAKSLSHDGRISVPQALGGEELLRSVSQCQSPVEGSHTSSVTGGVSCACNDANCACASNDASFRAFQQSHQRSAVSLDLGKSGLPAFSRNSSSPLPFAPHIQGGLVQSPDGHLINKTSLGHNGISALFAQTMSPGSGCEHSPSSSMGMQPHLCFDYASSSDYDSDHYPTSSYSYFPETLASYPVSNASDDMEDMDVFNASESKKIMEDLMSSSSVNGLDSPGNDMQMLYSALSGFSANSPAPSMTPPLPSFSSGPIANGSVSSGLVDPSSSSSTTKKGCCGSSGKKPREIAPSPAPSVHSTPSRPASAGRSDGGSPMGVVGCGCAISASMCCCGERCACPGCLAYPNNSLLNTDMGLSNGVTQAQVQVPQAQAQAQAQSQAQAQIHAQAQAQAQAQATEKSNMALMHDLGLLNNSGDQGSTALNLTDALSLIATQNARNGVACQDFSGLGALNSMELAKMQHPTLLGDDGVLICGCGCRRPTVDCAECFRDMCQFVGESQAKMLKDDIEYGSGGGDGMDLHMPMSMNMSLAMNMNMNMDMGLTSSFGQPQTMSLLMQRSGSGTGTTMSGEQQMIQVQQTQDQEFLIRQQQQLAQQMEARLSLRRQFRETIDEDQRIQLELMEKEQMQIQQLQQQSGLNPLQLDFLDDQDWSFVDEIRNEGADLPMQAAERS